MTIFLSILGGIIIGFIIGVIMFYPAASNWWHRHDGDVIH